jgi:hypothetical protein
MNGLIGRMIRASRLDAALYEEVEADKTALLQATVAVVISSLAAGLGAGGRGFGGLLTGTIAALAGWYLWSFITYVIGTKVLPQPQTKADYGELLRTIGFSSSPGVIRILGVVPTLTGVVFMAASAWMMVAMVIAVRQALDYTGTLRALAVVVIGWLIQAIILVVMMRIIGFGSIAGQ